MRTEYVSASTTPYSRMAARLESAVDNWEIDPVDSDDQVFEALWSDTACPPEMARHDERLDRFFN